MSNLRHWMSLPGDPDYLPDERRRNTMRKKCPDCGLEPLPCPFCGAPGEIFGDNLVGCSDTVNCGGNVDFGHWTGVDSNGVTAVHHVIEQWNLRVYLPSQIEEPLTEATRTEQRGKEVE